MAPKYSVYMDFFAIILAQR